MSVEERIVAAAGCAEPTSWEALDLLGDDAVYFCDAHKRHDDLPSHRVRVCGKTVSNDAERRLAARLEGAEVRVLALMPKQEHTDGVNVCEWRGAGDGWNCLPNCKRHAQWDAIDALKAAVRADAEADVARLRAALEEIADTKMLLTSSMLRGRQIRNLRQIARTALKLHEDTARVRQEAT